MSAQAGDVYAFGVLLWELAAGQAMFAGLPWAQVMGAVTLRHARPRLPPGHALPSGLEPVVRMCLAPAPADRPSFPDVGLALPGASLDISPSFFPSLQCPHLQTYGQHGMHFSLGWVPHW